LAHCCFPVLAISNAKMSIYFSNKTYRSKFYQAALGNCYGLKLAKCWLQLKKKILTSFIVIFGTLSFPMRFSTGGVAICCVVPVLHGWPQWSWLYKMVRNRRRDARKYTQCKSTEGSTDLILRRILKLTYHRTPNGEGAETAIYDCLASSASRYDIPRIDVETIYRRRITNLWAFTCVDWALHLMLQRLQMSLCCRQLRSLTTLSNLTSAVYPRKL